MTRNFATALIAAVALGAAALAADPAVAMPGTGAAALEMGHSASINVEQVRFSRPRAFHRRFGVRRGYGYRGGYGYRRFGYRRGLPGHPIRRILRAL